MVRSASTHARWDTMGGSVLGCVAVPTTLHAIIKMAPATVTPAGLDLTAPSGAPQGLMGLVAAAAFAMVSVIM